MQINHKGIILKKDEHPRKDLKLSDLEKLKTVFQENGTVTPGNSCLLYTSDAADE